MNRCSLCHSEFCVDKAKTNCPQPGLEHCHGHLIRDCYQQATVRFTLGNDHHLLQYGCADHADILADDLRARFGDDHLIIETPV